MHEALLTLGFGLVGAAILSLSALAFTLEYSVTNVANLSHGEILTVGAYCAYLVQQHGGGVILSGLAAAAGGGALALAVHPEWRHKPDLIEQKLRASAVTPPPGAYYGNSTRMPTVRPRATPP